MVQQIPLHSMNPVLSIRAAGDLAIRGTDRQMAESQDGGDELSVLQEGDRIQIVSRSDCNLLVPTGAELEIDKVGGDAEIQQITGEIRIGSVGGDLAVTEVGSLRIEKVGGDFAVKNVHGDLNLIRVGGDLACKNVQGSVSIEAVGGNTAISDVTGGVNIRDVSGDLGIRQTGNVDVEHTGGDLGAAHLQGNLMVRRCRGDLEVKDVQGSVIFETTDGDFKAENVVGGVRGSIGGDAVIKLSSPVTQDITLNAGGDVVCAIPPDIDASFRLGSSGQRILITVAERREVIQALTHQFQVGEGKAQINLNAGGDIQLSTIDRMEYAPSGNTIGGALDWDRLSETINQSIDRSIRASIAASGRAEQVEQRTRHALERAERRVQEAMRRVQILGVEIPPTPPVPPQPPVDTGEQQSVNEPVTDEERLMILRMVQDKKITIEQAEQLLEALDAQDFDNVG